MWFKGKPESRWRRRAGVAGLVALALAALAVVTTRLLLSGERLANRIESMLNESVRGTVAIGSVDWSLADLPALITGGWAGVHIEDVTIHDEFGELVLEAPTITAELDVHPALLSQNLHLRHIRVVDGGYALIKEVREPHPSSQYDTDAVSLLSSFYPVRGPSFHAGIVTGEGQIFDLQDFAVDGVTLEFRYPTFTAIAKGITGEGFLYYDSADPLGEKLFYSLSPRAEEGVVTVGPVAFALRDIHVERLAQVPARWPREMVPRDMEYRATALSGADTRIRFDGRMIDSWIDIFGGDYDMTLEIERAGDLAALVSDGAAGGEDLTLELRIFGPSLAPRFNVRLEGLDLHIDAGADEPLDLHLERAAASFDLATEAGSLEDTVAVGAGGKVELAATFQLDPLSFDLDAEVSEPMDLGPYLPADVARLAGTELSGSLRAFGTGEVQRLGEIDLRLGDARVTGEAYRTAEGLIHADGVDITLRGTRIENLAGIIDGESGALDLDFSLLSQDLRRWLRAFSAPQLASRVRGRVHVGGNVTSPTARASLVAGGVPVVGRVGADVRYAGGEIRVDDARAGALGGRLRGSGRVDLGGARPFIAIAEAQGENLDLSKLPLVGALMTGQADVKVRASGPARRPEASVTAALANWSIGGAQYEDTTITVAAERGTTRLSMTLERILGGVLDVDAMLDPRGGLGGALTLSGLPIDSLFGQGELAPLGGDLSARIDLGGTVDAPTIAGHATLLRSWLEDAFFGTAEISFEPAGPGAVGFRVSLLQGRVFARGTLETAPPFRLEARARLRRVELDRFAPDLAEQYGARAWISGELSWNGPLLVEAGTPEVTAQLDEAVLLLDNEDHAGRPAPIRVQNRSPVSLSWDGQRLRLVEPAVWRGPTGDFVATGAASPQGFDLGLSGRISVDLLEPYLRKQFEDMSGELEVEARLTGPLDEPRVIGVVQLHDIRLKPAGQDAIVTVPAGKIDFSNDQLALTGLSMVVHDEFSDETAELRIAGGVKLEDFSPRLWAVRIDGQLAGKMLLAVAPQLFSAAAGSADVSVALLGTGTMPGIDGTIEFDPDSPLALTPRGLRREIMLTGGAIRFTDQLIELERIEGWIDDEGQLTDVSGEISLEDWQPLDVDLSVSARDLPFRVPGELELTLNLRNLQVIGGVQNGLEIAGEIEVVDGRYVRKFNPVLDALRPARSSEAEAPFYEGVPLLANARLSLVLATRAFFVRNNVANIELSGEVEVTGTPQKPRFAGVIRVEQGNFKFQGVRARFERTTGTVTFSPYQDFPEDTPVLELRSESNYRDLSGQDHLVTLALHGPLSNLDWDLSTAAGLNRAQTLTLIFAGRTPDDARQVLLGEQPVGRGATDFEGTRTTASSDGTFQAADQLVKDLAGDFFSLLIEDRLRDVTGLDVARLQVGTASVGFHGRKDLTKSMRFLFEVERTLRGWSWDVRGQYRINDTMSIDGEILHKNFDDSAERDEDQERLKATWRFLIP